MGDYINLSEADKIIMDIIWELGEVSNAVIMEKLDGFRDWSRHTVKTYLRRLIEKGLVGIRQVNSRKNIYYPLITKETFMAEDASAYLKDHYRSLSHMVAGLIEREKVSDKEINDLQKIINDYKLRGR